MRQAKFTFTVFIEEIEGASVGYCLEMGLSATSDDASTIPGIMLKLISRQLEFALKNSNPSDIFHSAPPEIWEKYRAALAKTRDVEHTQKHFGLGDWPNVSIDQFSYVGDSALLPA